MIMILWVIIIAACVGLDQLTKALISGSYALNESHEIIRGVINFHYIKNTGAAWGIFSNHRWIFIAASMILIIILPIILYRYRKAHFLFCFSLSIIIGGAIGNMIDRLFIGAVTDFIETAFMDFPVFNVADCFVTVGAALMFIYLIFIDKTIFRSDKKSKKEADADVQELPKSDENDNTDGESR